MDSDVPQRSSGRQAARPSTNIHAYPVQYAPLEDSSFFEDPAGALYAHVPFCTKKCHFCDFAITTVHDGDLRSRYVDALRTEIAMSPDFLPVPRSRFDAIYIGGGTPGLLTAPQLGSILEQFRSTFTVSADAEAGVEFDPANVSEDKTQALVDLGFNRFSVGVQSFEDEVLARVNRAHDAATAVRAVEVLIAKANQVGATVNLDLIYPLPGLTQQAWLDGVRRSCDLGVHSITLYGLEIWPKTVFHHWKVNGRLDLPDRQSEIDAHLAALDTVRLAGYRPGAASGWLSPDNVSSYSIYLDIVWSGDPILGFGVSARSTVGRRSWTETRSIPQYLERVSRRELPIENGCTRTSSQSMRQHVIRGFKRGFVDPAAFLNDFGEDVHAAFPKQLQALRDSGMMTEREGLLELTDLGRVLIANISHAFTTADDRDSKQSVQVGVSFEPVG